MSRNTEKVFQRALPGRGRCNLATHTASAFKIATLTPGPSTHRACLPFPTFQPTPMSCYTLRSVPPSSASSKALLQPALIVAQALVLTARSRAIEDPLIHIAKHSLHSFVDRRLFLLAVSLWRHPTIGHEVVWAGSASTRFFRWCVRSALWVVRYCSSEEDT